MDRNTELLHEISGKLDGIDRRFDGLNERFDGLNERFGRLNERFDGLGGGIEVLNERVASNGERLERLERIGEATNATLVEMREQNRFVVRYLKTLAERDSDLGTEVSSLRRRVDALEEHAGLKDEI